MSDHQSFVAHQFDDREQQKDASTLGMWTFLATEILFFGALFMAYIVYRSKFPDAFATASHHMDILLGTVNTAVLLGSSLTMALAVRAAQTGKKNNSAILLVATMVLGTVFLGIKGIEYHHKYVEHLIPGASFEFDNPNVRAGEIYFILYFVMTGLHALHMIIGVGLVGYIVLKTMQGRYSPEYYNPVEVTGLYWHFVDIVWIFLFPLLYLININVHH